MNVRLEHLMERALEAAQAKSVADTLRSHGKPHDWAAAEYQEAVTALRTALEAALGETPSQSGV